MIGASSLFGFYSHLCGYVTAYVKGVRSFHWKSSMCTCVTRLSCAYEAVVLSFLYAPVLQACHVPVSQVCYGSTETSPVTFQSLRDCSVEKRVSTVGCVASHVEVNTYVDFRAYLHPTPPFHNSFFSSLSSVHTLCVSLGFFFKRLDSVHRVVDVNRGCQSPEQLQPIRTSQMIFHAKSPKRGSWLAKVVDENSIVSLLNVTSTGAVYLWLPKMDTLHYCVSDRPKWWMKTALSAFWMWWVRVPSAFDYHKWTRCIIVCLTGQSGGWKQHCQPFECDEYRCRLPLITKNGHVALFCVTGQSGGWEWQHRPCGCDRGAVHPGLHHYAGLLEWCGENCWVHQAGPLVLHRVCESSCWRLVLNRRKLPSISIRTASFTQVYTVPGEIKRS